jgi:restriction endonuclease S subunit
MNILQELFKGATIKHLSKENLKKIKIPVPNIEIQKNIVSYLNFIYDDVIKNLTQPINDLTKLNVMYIQTQSVVGINEVKMMGEVSNILNGKRIVKDKVEKGEYPVLGGGGYTDFYTNIYNREGKTCKISRDGMSKHNCVMILNEKYYLNSSGFTINSKTEILKDEYLWYFLLSVQDEIYTCGRGCAQTNIDVEMFNKIKIYIPSLEVQE